jgi:molybdate transport system ATP-binding protein
VSIVLSLRATRGDFVLDTALEVPSRGVTAVLGPSGAGKTTLLRAVAGLDSDVVGRVEVDGRAWLNGRRGVPTHRREVGLVFQEASLFDHLSVRGNLEYGLSRTPPESRRLGFEDAVALLGVEGLLDRGTDGLSGGERQRVAIARAVLASPKLLLMDEPLAALDLDSRASILPWLDRLHRELEIPILYVSHAIDEAARLADHLVLLDNGRVTASGAVAEVLTRLDLPLAHGENAQSVIDCAVDGHDVEYDLTRLTHAGCSLIVPRSEHESGSRVRVRLLARDVSLALEETANTSILNILPAVVTEVADHGPAQVTVRLAVGGWPILARITRRSAAGLGVEPGLDLYAQVKSIALLT